ncbi:hypothetical protein D9M71_725870 [compost metagenome]
MPCQHFQLIYSTLELAFLALFPRLLDHGHWHVICGVSVELRCADQFAIFGVSPDLSRIPDVVANTYFLSVKDR